MNSELSTRDTAISGRENAFTAILPLMKGFNASGIAELKVEYLTTPLEVHWIQPRSETGVTVDGDLFVDGNLHYTTITSPYWAACRFNTAGAVLVQKGEHDITCAKLGSDSAYGISYPAHPDGVNAVILLTSTEFHTCYRSQTSTGVRVYVRGSTNAGSNQGDGDVNVVILK